MRLTLRLADALRSPARLAGFARRAVEILVRGELPAILERLRPRSPSAAEYRAWRAEQPRSPGSPPAPFVIALDGAAAAGDAASQVCTSLARAAADVLIRGEQGWSRAGDEAPRTLAACVAASGAQWVWWVARPVRFEPDAAEAIAAGCAVPGARVVYADHDVEDATGRPAQPWFKGAWDAEQIREHDGIGPLVVVHASLAAEIDAARDAGGAWGFLLRAQQSLDAAAFVHVPRVVLHLPAHDVDRAARAARAALAATLRECARAEGDEVDVDPDGTPWVRYRPRPGASVSVVVPTRDRVDLLARCLHSVLARRGTLRVEIVVVDNGSTDPALAPMLAGIGAQAPTRTVRVDEPFNFARLCNAGVAAATGEVVVLLNNDAVLASDEALAELVALAGRPNAGAVGPLLVYPDGRIQSAGVFVGVNRTATSALQGFLSGNPAVRRWCAARRRVSALMGACLAVDRRKYRAVGGMDEGLAVSHNEVDLCLRLEAAGWANLFTPFACVVHDEGASRGFEVTRAERARLMAEEARFLARWAHVLAAVDPAHHPSLARRGNPFFLGPPGAAAPRAGWRERARDAAPESGRPQA